MTFNDKVLDWEKVHTTKGVFEAFKLSSFTHWVAELNRIQERIETYYYSPKVKAIILRKQIRLRSGSLTRERTVTVVDFNVSN